jgi:hypothetical protein
MCIAWPGVISSAVTIAGPMLPDLSKFLPWVTLNLSWRSQSAVPSLPGVAGDNRGRGPSAALPPDHHGDLALVIELLGHFRTHQRLPGTDERAGVAVEHAGIFRHVGIVEIGVAVGVIDADAEDFLGRQQRRQQLDLRQRKVGPHPRQHRPPLGQGIRTHEIDEAREPRPEPHPEVHHAFAHDGAETRPPVGDVTCKTHTCAPLSPAPRRLESGGTMPDIAAFYTGNLKTDNMPIYGPNLDPPFNSVRASGPACAARPVVAR